MPPDPDAGRHNYLVVVTDEGEGEYQQSFSCFQKQSLIVDNKSDSPIFYKSCFTGGQSVPLFHGLA